MESRYKIKQPISNQFGLEGVDSIAGRFAIPWPFLEYAAAQSRIRKLGQKYFKPKVKRTVGRADAMTNNEKNAMAERILNSFFLWFVEGRKERDVVVE